MPSAALESCNTGLATELLDPNRKMKLTPTNANDFWKNCQVIFGCSPSARSNLQEWTRSRGGFRVGFYDQAALKEPLVGGFYLPGSNAVYLADEDWDLSESCSSLLHELAHRYDSADVESHSLRREFRSFWHQAALRDDLYLAKLTGGPPPWLNKPFATREAIAKDVAEHYGFPYDKKVIEGFPKLPYEALLPQ